MFFLCPYLEQTDYFGVDFWRTFGLTPAVVGKAVARGVKAAEGIHACQMEHYAEQEDEDEVRGTTVLSKPGKDRFCLDVRKLNALTIKDAIAYSLKAAVLTIGLKKSKFCFKSLTYLGFIVEGGLLRMDPGRVSAIQKMPFLKSVNEVRAFLGTAGWYRRFGKKFATLAAPLSKSLKKARNTKFSLSPSATQAVDDLKLALTSAPVLVHAHFKKHFYIQCNASQASVSAVLFQRNQDRDEQPIAFFSAKMNKHQGNYSVTEKECLAAILAIWKFRPYVEGMPFTRITDHASLKWLMTMKDLSGRLARWSLQLQGYDFSIEHGKGNENVVPDTLSRIIEEVRIDPTELLAFETYEFDAEDYTELVQDVESNREHLPDLKVVGGLIFKRTISLLSL